MTTKIKCKVCVNKDALVYYYKIPCCVNCYYKKRGNKNESQRGLQRKN